MKADLHFDHVAQVEELRLVWIKDESMEMRIISDRGSGRLSEHTDSILNAWYTVLTPRIAEWKYCDPSPVRVTVCFMSMRRLGLRGILDEYILGGVWHLTNRRQGALQ